MAIMVIPCSLHNIAVVASIIDKRSNFQSVDTLILPRGLLYVLLVAPEYAISEDRKKSEDKVSALPTTPVT